MRLSGNSPARTAYSLMEMGPNFSNIVTASVLNLLR